MHSSIYRRSSRQVAEAAASAEVAAVLDEMLYDLEVTQRG